VCVCVKQRWTTSTAQHRLSARYGRRHCATTRERTFGAESNSLGNTHQAKSSEMSAGANVLRKSAYFMTAAAAAAATTTSLDVDTCRCDDDPPAAETSP